MPADHGWRSHVDVDELLIGLEDEEREHEVQPPAVLKQPKTDRQQHRIDDQGRNVRAPRLGKEGERETENDDQEQQSRPTNDTAYFLELSELHQGVDLVDDDHGAWHFADRCLVHVLPRFIAAADDHGFPGNQVRTERPIGPLRDQERRDTQERVGEGGRHLEFVENSLLKIGGFRAEDELLPEYPVIEHPRRGKKIGSRRGGPGINAWSTHRLRAAFFFR